MKLESPKTRFHKSGHSRAHSETVSTPAFRAALDAALLQMEYLQGTANDMGNAAAKHFLLEGGRKFSDILLTLAEVENRPESRNVDSLPHPGI